MDIQYLGRRDYNWTWNYQKSLFEKRLDGSIPDTLLFVEHDPVYTIGRTGSEDNILVRYDRVSAERIGDARSDAVTEKISVPVIHIDRGGDVTFHGPGQLVGYPVMKLSDFYLDLHRYLRNLEDVIIQTLAEFEISAGREKGLTGVWVDGSKIAAIGVKVTKWITMHGFALNVFTDLEYFKKIVPCGIENCRVTSMKELTGKEYSLQEVSEVVADKFGIVFNSSKTLAANSASREDN